MEEIGKGLNPLLLRYRCRNSSEQNRTNVLKFLTVEEKLHLTPASAYITH